MEKKISIRRVNFPIKFKIILLLVVLLTSSVFLYLTFAIDLFTKDKSAYLYESSLSQTEIIAVRVEEEVKTAKELLNSLYLAHKELSPENLRLFFNSTSILSDFAIVESRDDGDVQILGLSDQNLLTALNLPADYFIIQKDSKEIPYLEIKKEGEKIFRSTSNSNIETLVLAKFFVEDRKMAVGRLFLGPLIDIINKNKSYKTAVLTASGQPLIDPTQFATGFNFQTLLEQKKGSGVKEIASNAGSIYLVSYQFIPDLNLVVVSGILKDAAFSITDYLVNKSLFVGIFILSISIVIGILFSRGVTKSIEQLSEAVSFIASGDFTKRVKVKSLDEIGALSDSFNYMSDQIIEFMEKMKEKIRMENEMVVAQLVQSSFFPPKEIETENLSIAAYYRPATECGGDWWSHIEIGNKSVIFIADATGHGVPAALLTATANCCANNLRIFAKENPALLDSPAQILNFFNQAVASVGDKILMTTFCGVIDHKSLTLTYANASHNPPLLISPQTPEVTMENLKSLVGEIGPHLGKSREANYPEISVPILSNDAIILYTDGLVEALNSDSKAWGSRRLLKALAGNFNADSKVYRDGIMNEALTFYGDVLPQDDITMVVVRVKNAEATSTT